MKSFLCQFAGNFLTCNDTGKMKRINFLASFLEEKATVKYFCCQIGGSRAPIIFSESANKGADTHFSRIIFRDIFFTRQAHLFSGKWQNVACKKTASQLLLRYVLCFNGLMVSGTSFLKVTLVNLPSMRKNSGKSEQ